MLKRAIRYILTTLLYTTISLLVFFAIVLSVARISLPIVENYKSEIEVWISDYIGQQVDIATLDAVWYGLEPQLVLKGVQLLSKDRMNVYGYFQDARLGLNLVASLVEGRFVPGAFTVEGARFGIIRNEDGSISVKGIATDPSASTQSSKFLEDWIFNQRILDIKNSEIVWTDLKRKRPSRLFNNVNLRFINNDDRHVVQGSVKLPKQIGSSIDVIIDAKGNLLSANKWKGRLYLSTNHLKLNEFVDPEIRKKTYFESGAVSAKVWTRWDRGQMISSTGEVELSKLVFSAPESNQRKRKLALIRSNYSATKKENSWQFAIDDLVVSHKGRLWPASNANVKYDLASNELLASVDYMRFGDLVSLGMVSDKIDDATVELIKKIRPEANLKKINLLVRGRKFYLSGNIEDFSNISVDKIPGFRDVDAAFNISNNVASINLKDDSLIFSYPRVYEQDSHIKNVSTQILFARNESSWNLSLPMASLSFKATKAIGSLSLLADEYTESPLLDLSFYLSEGKLSDARYYIPGNIMNRKAVSWIKDSLNQGNLTHAVIAHYGEVKNYPYKGDEGVFAVNIGVRKGLLQFDQHWPKIEAIDGEFRLKSRSFKFLANAGRSEKNKLSKVLVNFPDFFSEKKDILIDGTISGNSTDKLAYLHNTPLEKLFAAHISPMQLEGESQVKLSLDMPLVDVKATTVNGEVKLVENKLLSDAWKLDVKKLNGTMHFTEKSLNSELLTARIFDTPINASIKTVLEKDDNWMVISGVGMFDDAAIKQGLAYYLDKKIWGKFLAGKANLMATVSIPFSIREEEGNKVKLQLQSSLKGLRVELPDPLSKEADSDSNFGVDVDLTGSTREISILYGDYNALLQAKVTATSYAIERGSVGLMQTAVLPQEHGYHFSGRLPKFYWSQWSSLFFPENEEDALFQKGGGGSLFFNINIADAEVFGKKFTDVNLHASQTVQHWSLHVAGPQLEGTVSLPIDIATASLGMNLKKLYIEEELPIEKSKPLDPRNIPVLELKIDDLRYKTMSLGKVALQTLKVKKGQEIKSLRVQPSGADIVASGSWLTNDEDKQQTNIKAEVKASKLGKALDAWDFKDVLDGGVGNIKIDAQWPGSPADFSLEALKGALDIKLKDASLLDFDMGAAKLFTVLLPRRLLLDFRDVAREGLYFDDIEGKYKIESGDAFTNSLQLRGPVADINLAGKIGLASRTFDQVVTVNRRLLGDSIPLVGTVIPGAGPIVGGGLFVMKKLFEKQIDDILSVQYTIEGTWGSPIVKPVEKTSPDVEGSRNTLAD